MRKRPRGGQIHQLLCMRHAIVYKLRRSKRMVLLQITSTPRGLVSTQMNSYQRILVVYILAMALVANQEWNKFLESKENVRVYTWICYKTHHIASIHSKSWNETLHKLPHLQIVPHMSNKPLESLFQWPDRIFLNYSAEAAAMQLHSEWHDGTLCLEVMPHNPMLNLFTMSRIFTIWNTLPACILWSLSVPIKIIIHLIALGAH